MRMACSVSLSTKLCSCLLRGLQLPLKLADLRGMCDLPFSACLQLLALRGYLAFQCSYSALGSQQLDLSIFVQASLWAEVKP